MDELKIFENPAFGSVRVVEQDGEPWFVASDVAKALGYGRPNDAVNAHCKKVNKFSYGDLPYSANPYNIIPESPVFRFFAGQGIPAQKWQPEKFAHTTQHGCPLDGNQRRGTYRR